MSENKKTFDAVEMMRELRQTVGRELDGKDYEEQRRYIDERLKLPQSRIAKREHRKAV